jgi:hypothetical protein
MSDEKIRQVIAGQKALVVGVANDQSIAYGCTKAFRTVGAELAITRLNERARPYVEPLARELQATITGALDVSVPGQLEAISHRIRAEWGQDRHSGTLDRLRAQGGPSRRAAELFRRRLCQGDGHLVPFVRPNGETGRATDA